MIIATFIQLIVISVFHHVPDTYNMRLGLKYTPKSKPSEQISHALSNHQYFISLVPTVTLFSKIIFINMFNSSYTEKNNYFAVRTDTRFTVYICLLASIFSILNNLAVISHDQGGIVLPQ